MAMVGTTLVITGSAGDDVVRLMLHGRMLRVYADFLPAGVEFLAFRRAAVKQVLMRMGDGNDFASVGRRVRQPVLMDGGTGDDQLMAGGGSSWFIGSRGRDNLRGFAGVR